MRHPRAFQAAVVLGSLLSFAAAPARAFFGADELKIYSPQVTPGERELEYIGYFAPQGEQGDAVSAGYAFSRWFAAEAYQVWQKDPGPGNALKPQALELEGQSQLFPMGRYWLDLGLLGEWELPQQDGDPGEIRLTPLIEKQFGDVLVTLNLPLEWQYGANAQSGTDLSVKLRGQYLLHPKLSPGFEYFSEEGVLGRLPSLSGQTHAVGPGLFGSWYVGRRKAIRYRVVGLFGLTAAAPSWAEVNQLEIEF